MDYDDIITIDPDKVGGRHCVRDLYAVQDVLDYRAACPTETDVLAHFPGLTPPRTSVLALHLLPIESAMFGTSQPRIQMLRCGNISASSWMCQLQPR